MFRYIGYYLSAFLAVCFLTSFWEVLKRAAKAIVFLYKISIGKIVGRLAKFLSKPFKAIDYAMVYFSAVVACVFFVLGYYLLIVPFYYLAIKGIRLLWQGKKEELWKLVKDAISGRLLSEELGIKDSAATS